MLVRHASTGPQEALFKKIQTNKKLLCMITLVVVKTANVVIYRERHGVILKSVPHVQHA